MRWLRRGRMHPPESAHSHTNDLSFSVHEVLTAETACLLQDNMTLVHWWYYPDSYREWKPQSEIEGKPEPAMPTPQLWKVQVLCLLVLAGIAAVTVGHRV